MTAIGERQFGPYRLVQQIAVGGMAEIHLAKTHGIAGFEKYVALKMIHPNFSQDHHFIQMLIDEAKITVQLQHVNIAQTFDLGRVGDTFYITMEYVDGADLYRLLRKSSEQERMFPIPLSAFIGKEVASGLDYAHRKRDHNGRPLGIVHRDVSPQNVLISYAGEVKLVDFGIAKATMRARQTAAGVIKGKYYYMSPEQAWGEPLDHRTDIFSAGILLYETLTGQMLYLEEDLHKLLDMVRRADIPPPSTVRPEVPPQLDAIVMRALSKQQDDRYQTAGDLANALERFLHAYAPVFTANKVAAWIYEVIGAATPPAPEPEEEPEPERDRGETKRLTRDQLVLARSEFTDENSIIFAAFGDRESSTGGGRSTEGMDETSTFDSPGGGPEDVDSLPEAPRDQEPARRPGASPARQPASPPAESAPSEEVEFVEPPTGRRLPGLPPAASATEAPKRIVPPPPGLPARSPRSPDQETRLLKDPVHLPPLRPAAPAPPVVPRPAEPSRRGIDSPTEVLSEEEASGTNPDDATLISEAPSWWNGPGDHTEVAAAPFAEHGFSPPRPDDVDHEAPTLLKAPPVKGPPESWERAPALAAKVPQPAISQLKPPRISRRTPATGAPVRSHGAGLAEHEPARQKGPPGSVLASLLAPGESRGVPEVALSPPTRLGDRLGDPPRHAHQSGTHQSDPLESDAEETAPADTQPIQAGMFEPSPDQGFAGPPMPAAVQQSFSTRAMAAALERDEIPDHYKIRRSKQPTPWLIGLSAFILSATVAAVLLAIYGTGESGAGEGDAVLHIVSIPAGARVTVDGQTLPEPTPTAIRGAPGLRLLIAFELPRYQREEQEFVVPDQGDEHQVIARLDPMVVKLIVESEPSGAEVFIGGNSVGRTPLELPGLDPQSTTSVELRLKGYRPVRQALQWTSDSEERLLIRLTQ
ncbi:MAG TPA: protein kinase [Kofleriaceae bacterium]|nr:protein kinase [Kofleriaceae bacterium]